jgi:hypothetical protein
MRPQGREAVSREEEIAARLARGYPDYTQDDADIEYLLAKVAQLEGALRTAMDCHDAMGIWEYDQTSASKLKAAMGAATAFRKAFYALNLAQEDVNP